MDLLKKNLEIIEKQTPELAQLIRQGSSDEFTTEIKTARSNAPTLLIKKENQEIFLHSKFDPQKEADKIATKGVEEDSDIIVLGGFGLGYLAESLLNKYPKKDLVVVEKEFAIIKTAFENRDLTKLLTSGHFDFVVTEEIDDLTTLLDSKKTKKIAMLIHRPSFDIFTDFYKNLKNVLYSFINRKEVNIATLSRFEELWTRNILRNLKRFATLPGINQLKNQCKDIPAFIVGAGPSLSKNINELKKVKDRGIIIAVDTVYKVLLKHGIIPNFVVAVDPQLINTHYLVGLKNDKTILVTDSAINPSIFNNFPGKIYLSSIPFPLAKWFEEFYGKKGGLLSGGSVSTSAFDLAQQLDCNPITLLGQDLSYSKERIHVRGTTGEEKWENSCTRLTSTAKNYGAFLNSNKTVKVKSYYLGDDVWSDRKFLTFLWWFEKKARNLTDKRIINATEGGAAIKGCEQVSMKEIVKQLKPVKINLPEYKRSEFHSDTDFKIKIRQFDSFLYKVEKKTTEAIKICQDLLIDFSKAENSFKELEKIDSVIHNNQNYSALLSSILQHTIHTVTEGFELEEDENNSLDENEKTLHQSKALYENILVATKKIKGYIGKYVIGRI